MTSGASVVGAFMRALVWQGDVTKGTRHGGRVPASSFTSCMSLEEFPYLSKPSLNSYLKQKQETLY